MNCMDAVVDQDTKDACISAVVALFPHICPEFVNNTATTFGFQVEPLINHIMDEIEQGRSYKKVPRPTLLKRKRSVDKEKHPSDTQGEHSQRASRKGQCITEYEQQEARTRTPGPPNFSTLAKKRLEAVEAAKARGELAECQCCFDEFLMQELVCCQNDPPHWFCLDCARRYAESLMGESKYEMTCMAAGTDNECSAGFSVQEKEKFLTTALKQALDRIEAEPALRLAREDLEGLESCPFCPFAAVYPPMEENKEFKCEDPDCAVVSCRLCRKETHIPMTCEEAASSEASMNKGMKARKVIEEAMSDAIIRRCNKCNAPFIKEHGCNKMTCTRPGCGNTQCYLCGKNCDYGHFRRTGSTCILWDNSEARHQKEVQEAEEKSRKQVEHENPDISSEQLKFQQSSGVIEDDKRREQGFKVPHGAHQMPQGVRVAPRQDHFEEAIRQEIQRHAAAAKVAQDFQQNQHRAKMAQDLQQAHEQLAEMDALRQWDTDQLRQHVPAEHQGTVQGIVKNHGKLAANSTGIRQRIQDLQDRLAASDPHTGQAQQQAQPSLAMQNRAQRLLERFRPFSYAGVGASANRTPTIDFPPVENAARNAAGIFNLHHQGGQRPPHTPWGYQPLPHQQRPAQDGEASHPANQRFGHRIFNGPTPLNVQAPIQPFQPFQPQPAGQQNANTSAGGPRSQLGHPLVQPFPFRMTRSLAQPLLPRRPFPAPRGQDFQEPLK